MKKIYFYSLILFLLILQSCSYEPKGDGFKKVDPTGKTPEVLINLDLSTDTLYIPSMSTVTFAYGVNSTKINWAQFNINGGQANNVNIEPNQVTLTRSFGEPVGTSYSLEMKIFAKSQTGSIADKIGAEGYMLSRTWTIIIVGDSQLATHITKAEFVNGTLRIEWEKYKGMSFTDYKIYKSVSNSTKTSILLATIKSREQTSYIDSSYGGEQSYYNITINDRYNGVAYPIICPLPQITAENNLNGDILLKWTKPPYYKNLKGYRITYRDRMSDYINVVDLTDNTSESFLVTNPMFAIYYEYHLTPLSKSENYIPASRLAQLLSSYTIATSGVIVPYYNTANTGDESTTYLFTTDGIQQFDHRTLTSTKRFKYAEPISLFTVSANGKYLLTRVNTPQKIYLEDLTDPAKSKSIDISTSLPVMSSLASISNVGTGLLMNNTYAVLYDFINERKLAEINFAYNWPLTNKISPSGNFFYMGTNINCGYYQYKNNQAVLLQSGTNQGDDLVLYAGFLPGNNEKLVRAYHNRIEVVDCNTWTLEKQWLFPNLISGVYNLDIKSGKLFICEQTKLVLFDVMNGTREEIATNDFRAWESTTLFYNNGYLFWGEGKAKKTN